MKRANKRRIAPKPKSSNIPVAEGYPLDEQAIDSVAQAMYTRFYQQEGGPDYKNLLSEQARLQLQKRVRETLDCLRIKNYKVILSI